MRQYQFFFALFCSLCLHGQTVFEGLVHDAQNRPVDGAALTLFSDRGSSPLASTRTQNGNFRLIGEASKAYFVEVSADGFRKMLLPVSPGTQIDLQLEVAGVDQHVFVTAEALAQSFDQVSKAATLITSEEIAQRNEYSLSETLRDTPGVLIRNLGGPGQSTTIRVRGLRADATSILIDGLRFRDVATTQGDASSFASTLNIINADKVEILRGSGSSLYGSNAVGGTINVVTPQGGGPASGDLQVEGGNLGLFRTRGAVSGGVKDNRLIYSAGLLHLNVMSGVDGNDRARSTGFQGFTKYSLSKTMSLSGRLFFSDDFVQPNNSPTASGLPTANIPNTTIVQAIALPQSEVKKSLLGLPFDPGNATFIPNRDDPDNRRASRFWSGALVLKQSLSATADWQASYQRTHTNRVFMNGPAGVGSQPLVSNFSQFEGGVHTGDARVNWRPTRWDALTGGVELESESYLNADDNRINLSTQTRAGQRSQAYYFANQLLLAQQRLQISMSGRAQFFQLEEPSFRYKGTANPYETLRFSSAPRALTGDIAASYFIAKSGTKIRAHFGNSYRAPALYERFGSGFTYNSGTDAVAFSPYGDPRLSPDRYNSVDGGIDQYLWRDKLRFSGTWFYTRIARLTQFDSAATVIRPASDIFGRSSGYFNGSGGISRGAETTLEFRPNRGTLVRTSYTYVNADTDQDIAVRGFFQALSVPAHTFTAMVHQQLGKRTDITMDLFHSGDYYNSLSAAGRARAYLYGGPTKVDLVGNRELWRGEKYRLNAYAKVDNLLNRTYYENGFLAPRATFVTGFKVLFR
ncbi:TonB-dependent receptor [Bryobacter aggregatus]|uniref:TonB-dependent receptor n=1 Tax=Bryobacter aggregatus TaxID=360054 RepID=UPI0004E1FC62|nr:TonB-dependent receptor [Bryobacter aggregatus]